MTTTDTLSPVSCLEIALGVDYNRTFAFHFPASEAAHTALGDTLPEYTHWDQDALARFTDWVKAHGVTSATAIQSDAPDKPTEISTLEDLLDVMAAFVDLGYETLGTYRLNPRTPIEIVVGDNTSPVGLTFRGHVTVTAAEVFDTFVSKRNGKLDSDAIEALAWLLQQHDFRLEDLSLDDLRYLLDYFSHVLPFTIIVGETMLA